MFVVATFLGILGLGIGLGLRSAARLPSDRITGPPTSDVETPERPLLVQPAAQLGSSGFRHGRTVQLVHFLPGGDQVLSVGRDNTVRLWHLESGKELRRFILPYPDLANADVAGDELALAESPAWILSTAERLAASPTIQALG